MWRIARTLVSLTVLALAACGEEPARDAKRTQKPAAAAANSLTRSVGASSARLAYLLSGYSPLLDKAERIAIEQDFQGVPLSAAPAVHTIVAERVTCRPRAASDECTITFPKTEDVTFGGPEATALYGGLGTAGVTATGPDLKRSIIAVSCTVNDKIAQSVPSTGDIVAGFACRFTLAQD